VTRTRQSTQDRPRTRTAPLAGVALVVATLVVSGGCAVGPDAPPDLAAAPRTFAELDQAPTAATGTARPLVTDGEAGPGYEFWKDLRDPLLAALVDEALKENRDVARATARIREARAYAGIAESYLYPAIDVNAGYAYTRVSSEGPNLSRLNVDSIPGFDPHAQDWKGSLTMAYEVDLWGKLRRGREAAIDDLKASVESRRTLGLALAGDVSATYVDYRTLERRRRVAVDTIASRRSALELASARERAGLATDLDVARAETELATAEATVPELDRQLSLTEHRLSVLLGKPPGAARARIRAAGPMKNLEAFPVPIGLPAQLLARRPDLREASLRLAAATARIGQAKADMFPSLTLFGEVGLDAADITKFATTPAVYWSAGPQLKLPLFDAGRRIDQWTAAEEQAGQALHALEGAVLTALQEVEDALAGSRQEALRRDRLAVAVASARRALGLAEAKWRSGLVAYIDVIEAQRLVFQGEDLLEDAEGRVVKSAVSLAKAVGGGFEAAEARMPEIYPDRDKEGT